MKQPKDKYSSILIESTSNYLSMNNSSKFRSGVYLLEQEDSKITKKIGKIKTYHVGNTEQGHSVYKRIDKEKGESSRYFVEHPNGEMTHHVVVHGGGSPKLENLKKPSMHHNVDKLHPSVLKLIHNDLKEN